MVTVEQWASGDEAFASLAQPIRRTCLGRRSSDACERRSGQFARRTATQNCSSVDILSLREVLGTVESLYGSVSLLHLQRNKATTEVAKYLDEIGWTFANDYEYGHQLMVWREEQRAIAELMRAGAGDEHVIGFATFADRFQSTFAAWFAGLDRDIHEDGVENNRRLERLQELTGQLMSLLEERRIHS